jgi:hypothetical protein
MRPAYALDRVLAFSIYETEEIVEKQKELTTVSPFVTFAYGKHRSEF